MAKSEVGRLTFRLFTLFMLIACLALLPGGERTSQARTCSAADATRCTLSEGRWYGECCTCADVWETSSCEWDGMHWYNACTRECVLIQ